MGTPRPIPLVLALLAMGVGVVAGAQTTAQSTAGASDGNVNTVNASQVMLPCTPVAAYWNGPPPAAGMPPGPELAVVSIDVRPKDTRVHLDDRFVGRARYLDGNPGYLYLEPGTYDLELRLEGYRTVLVALDATSSCRYDLKHRMERAKGTSSGSPEDTYGKGEPFNRVYGPQVESKSEVASSLQSGPDPSLRRDLDRRSNKATGAVKLPGSSVRLRVRPDSASVSIDGVFVATGRELALMQGPLATTAGKHEIVVSASGFVAASKSIDLVEGEVLELEISLHEKRTD
jgi:hypothetical protein